MTDKQPLISITDDEIRALHPMETGRHDLYAEAMEIVHPRHSKADLALLVNGLLAKLQKQDAFLCHIAGIEP